MEGMTVGEFLEAESGNVRRYVDYLDAIMAADGLEPGERARIWYGIGGVVAAAAVSNGHSDTIPALAQLFLESWEAVKAASN